MREIRDTILKFTASLLVIGATCHADNRINLNDYWRGVSKPTHCPRNNMLKYRGVRDEMYWDKAVRAMLGDYNARMESILVSGVRQKLTTGNLSAFFQTELTTKPIGQPHWSPYINKTVNAEIADDNKDNNSSTATLARDIVYDNFNKTYVNNGLVVSHFLDYRDSSFFNWKTKGDPRDAIYSTIHMSVAARYSNNIAVIDEQTPHSMDMNCFNKGKNGAWVENLGNVAKAWADKGEFLHAIEIPAEDIAGYEIRHGNGRNFDLFIPLRPQLITAFYKYTYQGQSFVLAIDGHDQIAVHKNGNKLTYANGSNFTKQYPAGNAADRQGLTSSGAPVLLKAIISKCPKDEECKLPPGLYDKFKWSKFKLTKKQEHSITDMWIGRGSRKKLVKIFYEDRPIPEGRFSTADLFKKEDTVDLNKFTTDRIAHDKGMDKYLGATSQLKATSTDTNTVTYRPPKKNGQDSPIEMNSGDAIYFEIPSSFRDRKVSKISITANRVEDDKDETFISPQLLTSPNGNYLVPGNTSYRGQHRKNDWKGRWQIPFLDDGDPDSPIHIDGWGVDTHRGFGMKATSDSPAVPLLLRIMAMTESKYHDIVFKELVIEFE